MQIDKTALHFAAQRGHLDVVTLLLDRAADVNAKDSVSIDAW